MADGEHAKPHSSDHGADHAHAHDPLDAKHLIGHVKDAEYFELPRFLGGKIQIPQFLKTKEPIATIGVGFKPIDDRIEPLNLALTKFMVLEVVAAVIVVALGAIVASRLKADLRPRGKLTNLLEAMVVFIRDEVARPAI